MNILIANTQELNPTIGGVERISDAYARQLQALGHTVRFAACLRSPYSGPYTPAAPQLILPDSQYHTPENLCQLRTFIRENRIGIIHNQAGNIPKFTRLCAEAANAEGIPLVSAVHTDPMHPCTMLRDFRFSRVFPGEWLKALARMVRYPFRVGRIRRSVENAYRQSLADSTAVVVLSPAYLAPMKKILPSAGLTAIPNWLPFEEASAPAEKEKTLLYVGRLDFVHKRPDRLLEMWGVLSREFPDWTLKLAGDGPAGAAMRQYVKKHKLPRVEFLGFCDPREAYRRAGILCQTSTVEGLSMVLLEGMAYGCVPVVYDSYAAVYDVIRHGEDGMIVKAFCRQAYLNALRTLMRGDALRSRMAAAARDVGSRFRREDIIDQWLALYSRCMEEIT